MKYIYQFGIIIAISIVGEVLNKLIALPIPASIYGLLIMLFCLVTKIIKVEEVKETSDFLLKMMPLMFVPATVGIIDIWDKIADIVVPIIIITFATTVIVMAVTGKATEFVLKMSKNKQEE